MPKFTDAAAATSQPNHHRTPSRLSSARGYATSAATVLIAVAALTACSSSGSTAGSASPADSASASAGGTSAAQAAASANTVASIVAAGISIYFTVANGKKHDSKTGNLHLVVAPTGLGFAGTF